MSKRLFSSGYLASLTQCSVAEIEGELAATGHSPEMHLNDVAYWNLQAMEFLKHRQRHLDLVKLQQFLNEKEEKNGDVL